MSDQMREREPNVTTGAGQQILPLNVFETDRDIVVTAPMPGLEVENISVSIAGKTLIIKGELRGPGQGRRHYLVHEWTYGSYYRQIDLPIEVDIAQSNASYGNGVLAITLPKIDQRAGSPGSQGKVSGQSTGNRNINVQGHPSGPGGVSA